MRTKISLLIGFVAILTLSFTFVSVQESQPIKQEPVKAVTHSAPVGGLFADEVVE